MVPRGHNSLYYGRSRCIYSSCGDPSFGASHSWRPFFILPRRYNNEGDNNKLKDNRVLSYLPLSHVAGMQADIVSPMLGVVLGSRYWIVLCVHRSISLYFCKSLCKWYFDGPCRLISMVR